LSFLAGKVILLFFSTPRTLDEEQIPSPVELPQELIFDKRNGGIQTVGIGRLQPQEGSLPSHLPSPSPSGGNAAVPRIRRSKMAAF